jgi:hypothetical protein
MRIIKGHKVETKNICTDQNNMEQQLMEALKD